MKQLFFTAPKKKGQDTDCPRQNSRRPCQFCKIPEIAAIPARNRDPESAQWSARARSAGNLGYPGNLSTNP